MVSLLWLLAIRLYCVNVAFRSLRSLGRCLVSFWGSGAGPTSPLVRGPFAFSKHLGGAKALGGCRSLGCRGYLRALLDTRISPGTTTRFLRHLPQAHRLAMSLNVAKCNLG